MDQSAVAQRKDNQLAIDCKLSRGEQVFQEQ